VITSLWSVVDEKTKDLMVQFYQQLKRGTPKSEVLRQAKLSQIKLQRHPYYWSPFILIGDSR
jgi:CHAT domain-containing protein